MKTSNSSSSSLSENLKSGFAASVILIELVIGFLIWYFILGDGSHFVNGGITLTTRWTEITLVSSIREDILVPLAIGLLLMTFTFAIERASY